MQGVSFGVTVTPFGKSVTWCFEEKETNIIGQHRDSIQVRATSTRLSAHALGASVVWHHSLLLMSSFNKTDAAVFSCMLGFLRPFLFISLIQRFSWEGVAQNECFTLAQLRVYGHAFYLHVVNNVFLSLQHRAFVDSVHMAEILID